MTPYDLVVLDVVFLSDMFTIFLWTCLFRLSLTFAAGGESLNSSLLASPIKIQAGLILWKHQNIIDNLRCAKMTLHPLATIHFHSNLALELRLQDAPQKLEMVFVRPFLSHVRVHFGAQIRVEMVGCKQMKVFVEHHRIWLMHPRWKSSQEPSSLSGKVELDQNKMSS